MKPGSLVIDDAVIDVIYFVDFEKIANVQTLEILQIGQLMNLIEEV